MLDTTTSTALRQKLLIIEDEGEMCLLINLLLNDEDLEIEHVKTLSAAVEYFQQNTPALVLMDNRLPDGYGIDFISSIKNKHPETKVVMISGMDAAAKDVALEKRRRSLPRKTIYPFTVMQGHSLGNGMEKGGINTYCTCLTPMII